MIDELAVLRRKLAKALQLAADLQAENTFIYKRLGRLKAARDRAAGGPPQAPIARRIRRAFPDDLPDFQNDPKLGG